MDIRTSENTVLQSTQDNFDGLDAPIRTDFRASHELAEIGHWLATSKSITLQMFRDFRFPARLNDNEASILANYDAIATDSATSR